MSTMTSPTASPTSSTGTKSGTATGTAGDFIDPARLKRALALRVEKAKPGIYVVRGGSQKHFVHLSAIVGADGHNTPTCDCPDHLYRETLCKHILAVFLYAGLATLKLMPSRPSTGKTGSAP